MPDPLTVELAVLNWCDDWLALSDRELWAGQDVVDRLLDLRALVTASG